MSDTKSEEVIAAWQYPYTRKQRAAIIAASYAEVQKAMSKPINGSVEDVQTFGREKAMITVEEIQNNLVNGSYDYSPRGIWNPDQMIPADPDIEFLLNEITAERKRSKELAYKAWDAVLNNGANKYVGADDFEGWWKENSSG